MSRTSDVPDADPPSLGPSIAEVYGGPLDGFVARRDALVRDLRSAGRRDEAAEVKALRKPKALAWALDAGVLADPEAFAELDTTVEHVGEAQDGAGDVRGAIARLRAAEEAVVSAADDAARGHDHRVDRTALASALRTVVGSAAAMSALRAGRLVDTAPAADDAAAAGGDEMWAVPAAPRTRRGGAAKGRASGGTSAAHDRPRGGAAAPPVDAQAVRAARRTVTAAERVATKAAKAADKAEAAADQASAAARVAEDEAVTARRRADELAERAQRARDDADARAAARDDAAADLTRAHAALDELAPRDA